MARSAIVFIAVLAIASLAITADARTPLVPQPEFDEPVFLGRYLEVLEDPERKLSLEDIRSQEHSRNFKLSKSDVVNPGFTRSAFWVRFQPPLETTPGDELLLEIRFPVLDQIELYAPEMGTTGRTEYRKTVAGDTYPWSARELRYRSFVFRLPAEARVPDHPVFLRLVSDGPITVPAYLWNTEAFVSHERDVLLTFGIVYGLVLALVLYNLMVYVAIKDSTYLYYVLYGASTGIYLFSLDGLAFEHLWPSSVWMANQGQTLFYLFAVGFGTLFVRAFLDARRTAGLADLGLKLIAAAAFLLAFATAADCISSIRPILQAAGALTVTVSALSVFAATRALLSGNRAARFFLLAWIAMLVSMAATALRMFGIIPYNELTAYGIHIGLTLDLLLLSFALGDRINVMRQEAEVARTQTAAVTIASQHKSELLQKVLPEVIIPRLQSGESPIADQFADVTVIFADIVGFTPLSERLGPKRMVLLLNDLFGRFDLAASRLGVEKIETTGDGYLAVGGAPAPLDNHPEAVAEFALAVIDAACKVFVSETEHVQVRVGVHTGPVFAGVVGESRFHYKIFGETVNTASRIQGHADSGRILISESTFKRLHGKFDIKPHAVVDLKGHGPMQTYWLNSSSISTPQQKVT